jgi:DNA polymerase-4
VPGIGPRTVERLAAMGLTTLGALAAAGDDQLSARFGGRMGPWLRRRARFEDGGEVAAEGRVAVSESRETTFDTDIAAAPDMEAALRRLAGELCAGLQRHERRGRTIAIKVRLSDFTTVTRARTLPAATNDAAEVAGLAVTLLREYAPRRPVRLLGVRVASFVDDDGQAASVGASAAEGQLALPL